MTLDERRASLAQKIASMSEKQFQEFMRLVDEQIKSGKLSSLTIGQVTDND